MSEDRRTPIIRVITVVFNRPEFILYQYHALSKYLQNKWEFIVLSDAEVGVNLMDLKIRLSCQELQIKHVRVPPYIHNISGPSPRASNALDWALKNYVYNYQGFAMILDSDMFLVRNLDVIPFMQIPDREAFYDIAAVIKTISKPNGYMIRYPWMGMMIINGIAISKLDPEQIRFLNAVLIEGNYTDAGGPVHYYLQNHPNLNIKSLKHWTSSTWKVADLVKSGMDENPAFIEYAKKEKEDIEIRGYGEIISNYFYHYRGGSNWDNELRKIVDKRNKNINEFLAPLLPAKNQFVYCCGDENISQANGYIFEVSTEADITKLLTQDVREELILLFQTIKDPSAVICIDHHPECDSPLPLIPVSSKHYEKLQYGKSNLIYHRPNQPSLAQRSYWIISSSTWKQIFLDEPIPVANQISTTNKFYTLKPQHHYQIVVVGRKFSDDITLMLKCQGDIFQDELFTHEHSFLTANKMTRITHDFYHATHDPFSVCLYVKDNRPPHAKAAPLESFYQIKRAYIACLGELG